MGSLAGLTFLIFDESKQNAVHLRHCLVREGATVHTVCGAAAALMLIHRKRIDTVFIDLATEEGATLLVNELRNLAVPLIFTANRQPTEVALDAVLVTPRNAGPRSGDVAGLRSVARVPRRVE